MDSFLDWRTDIGIRWSSGAGRLRCMCSSIAVRLAPMRKSEHLSSRQDADDVAPEVAGRTERRRDLGRAGNAIRAIR